MQFSTLSLLLLGSLSMSAEAASNPRSVDRSARYLESRQNNNQNKGQNNNQNKGQNNGQNNGQGNGQLCLNSNLLQTASEKTGQETGTDGIKPGQAPSATDNANFINFCAGQTITNGVQITTGSCNGIPMGKIPATSNMITAMITNPQPGVKVTADQTFNISVQTQHLDAGFFVNPTTNYYTSPQDLNAAGDIIGHCHVTVQDIGSLTATTPPDPNKFAFFKGIDDAGNGKGLLQAVVTDGLPVGVYRVCTMIAARNHQPVNMPVAQRGAQDDCTKFEVVAGGNNGNAGGANKGNGKGKNNAGTANVGKMETGKVDGKAQDDPAKANQNAASAASGQAATSSTQSAAQATKAQSGGAKAQAGKGNGKAGGAKAQAGGAKAQAGNANAGDNSAQNATATTPPANANGQAANANGQGKGRGKGKGKNGNAQANGQQANGQAGAANTQQGKGNVQAANANQAAAGATTTKATAGSATFGSCTDPTIQFGAGFDGRKEDSFQPANKADFNHGSALNIGVVASFICDRLGSSCNAGQQVVDTCKTATTAAAAKTGQAAADAFNCAIKKASAGAARRRSSSDSLFGRAFVA